MLNASVRIGRTAVVAAWARFVVVVLICWIYFSLDQVYVRLVAEGYSFGGFELARDFSGHWGLVLVLITALLLDPRPKRMSDVFGWLSLVFILVPAAVLCARQGDAWSLLLMMTCAVWAVVAMARVFFCFVARDGVRVSGGGAVVVDLRPALSILAAVSLLLWSHVGGAMSFSIADVYDYRFDYNESIQFPLNYLVPFVAGALLGFFVAVGWLRKSVLVVCFGLLAGVLYFGLTSHKAMMFNPFFALGGCLLVAWRFGLVAALLGVWAICLVTVASAGYEVDLLGAVFANRLMFIPAQIHFVYFREFAEIGWQCWAESKLSFGLAVSDLSLPSVNYIGEQMTGDPRIGANVGWMANGFMNAGLVGVLFYAALLSVVLAVLDRWGERFGYSLVSGTFIVPIFAIVNSVDLLVGLLTGGLGALMLLFLFSVKISSVGLPLNDGVKRLEGA